MNASRKVSGRAFLLLQNIRADLRNAPHGMTKVQNPHVIELIEAGTLYEVAPREHVSRNGQSFIVYSVAIPPAPTCTDPDMHAKFEERGIGDQCPRCAATNPNR